MWLFNLIRLIIKVGCCDFSFVFRNWGGPSKLFVTYVVRSFVGLSILSPVPSFDVVGGLFYLLVVESKGLVSDHFVVFVLQTAFVFRVFGSMSTLVRYFITVILENCCCFCFGYSRSSRILHSSHWYVKIVGLSGLL